MYPNNQGQFQIPFDSYIENPNTQFAANNPPVIVSVNVDPMFNQWIPFITTCLINTAAQYSNRGPHRVYLFNQICINRFQNNTIPELVMGVCDLLQFRLISNQIPRIDLGIEHACIEVLDIAAANSVFMNPQLAQYIRPETMMEIQRVMPTFNNLVSAIAQMKQQLMNSRINQQQSQYRQQNLPLPLPQQRPQPRSISSNSRYSYLNTPPSFIQTDNSQDTDNSRYSYLNTPPSQLARQVEQTVEPIPTTNVEPTMIPENKKFFSEYDNRHINKPVAKNDLQFGTTVYPTAVDPKTYDDIQEKKYKGFPAVISTETYGDLIIPFYDDTGELVERSAHQISTTEAAFTNVIPEHSNSRKAAIEYSIEQQSNIVKFLTEKNPDDAEWEALAEKSNYCFTRNDTFDYEMFIEGAIWATKHQMSLIHDSNTPCTIYQRRIIICKPIICDATTAATLRSISSTNKIVNICNDLKKYVANPNIPSESRQAVMDIDNILTKAMNSVLSNKLGLTVTINSLLDDYFIPNDDPNNPQGLPLYLAKNKGETFAEAIMKNEEKFIRTYFSFLSSSDSDEQIERYYPTDSVIEVGEEENVDPKVILMENKCSITVVNVMASELGFLLSNINRGNSINQSRNPNLFKLVSNIITIAEANGDYFTHHLMVTGEGDVYELHKDWLRGDTYIISDYKP